MTFRGRSVWRSSRIAAMAAAVLSCLVIASAATHALAAVHDSPDLRGAFAQTEDRRCEVQKFREHVDLRACAYGFEAKRDPKVGPRHFYDLDWVQMRIVPDSGFCVRKAFGSFTHSEGGTILGYAPTHKTTSAQNRVSLSIRNAGGHWLGAISQQVDGAAARPLKLQPIEGTNRIRFSWENHHGLGRGPVELALGAAYSYDTDDRSLGYPNMPFVSLRVRACD